MPVVTAKSWPQRIFGAPDGSRLGERLDRRLRFGLIGAMLVLAISAVIAPIFIWRLAANLPAQTRELALIGDERALVLRAAGQAAELARPDSVVQLQDFAATIDRLDQVKASLASALGRASPQLRDLFLGANALHSQASEFIKSSRALIAAKPSTAPDLARDVERAGTGALQAGLAQASYLVLNQAQSAAKLLRWAAPLAAFIPLLLGFVLLASFALPPLTASRRLIAALEKLSGRDPLTGLLNRNSFMVRLRRLVRPGVPMPGKTGLILLDLDLFRAFNLEHGDTAGDLALRRLARRLRDAVPEGALVARLGSDEFAIAMPGLPDRRALEELAVQLAKVICEPLPVGNVPVRLQASGGAALAPDDASERSELLSLTEDALREAKREARGTVRLHTAIGNEAALRRAAMFRALEAEDFRGLTVHLQPQFEGRHLGLRGFEALARWHHPELGNISPADFIPAARSSRHMARMFAELLTASFAATNALRAEGVPVPRIGLNISSAELAEPEVLTLLPEALVHANLTPGDIEIQTTEALLTESSGHAARQLLSDLRAKGASLVLDDFGTGFASLPLLQQFAVDALMIDGTFVRAIGQKDGRAEEMIRAMIGMARGLGCSAVAENVETAQQLAFLRGLGVDAMQGYLFAPAMPVAEIPAWWRAYSIENRNRP